MAPPRLLAIAPDAWYADRNFPETLRNFAKIADPLGADAAVYLRAHGWTVAQWLEVLNQLERPRKLRIGVTLPVDAELPEQSEIFSDLGVDFVHVTERDADRPLQTWGPLQLSRVVHAPDQARRRLQLGAQWLVMSPVFATPSKPDALPLGLMGLQQAAQSCPGRVLALGGITPQNAESCLQNGAVGLAVQRQAWRNPAPLIALLTNA